MSILAYHTTSPQAARSIARMGFRVPRVAAHSRTDAPGMGGLFFRAVFFQRKRPDWRFTYGPALITARLHGKLIPYSARPGEGMVSAMQRSIRTARRVGAVGVDMGRDDYGIMIVDPRAIEIVRVSTRAYSVPRAGGKGISR